MPGVRGRRIEEFEECRTDRFTASLTILNSTNGELIIDRNVIKVNTIIRNYMFVCE